jgi:hypothetical protein
MGKQHVADLALMEISLALGGPDDWPDHKTMIEDVVARAHKASEALQSFRSTSAACASLWDVYFGQMMQAVVASDLDQDMTWIDMTLAASAAADAMMAERAKRVLADLNSARDAALREIES